MEALIPIFDGKLPPVGLLEPAALFGSPRLWAALFRHADRPASDQDLVIWIRLFSITCRNVENLVHDVVALDVPYFAQSSHCLAALRIVRVAMHRVEPLPLPAAWIESIVQIGEFVDARLWQWFHPTDVANAYQTICQSRGLLLPALAIHSIAPGDLVVPDLKSEELESILELFTPRPALRAAGLGPNAQLFLGIAAYCGIRGNFRGAAPVRNLTRHTIMLFLGFVFAVVPYFADLKQRLALLALPWIESLLLAFFRGWTGDHADIVGFHWLLGAVGNLREFLKSAAPNLVPVLLPFLESHGEFFAPDAVFRRELSDALAALSRLKIPLDFVVEARTNLFQSRANEIWELYLAHPHANHDPNILQLTPEQISTALESPETAVSVLQLFTLSWTPRDSEFLDDSQLFLDYMPAAATQRPERICENGGFHALQVVDSAACFGAFHGHSLLGETRDREQAQRHRRASPALCRRARFAAAFMSGARRPNERRYCGIPQLRSDGGSRRGAPLRKPKLASSFAPSRAVLFHARCPRAVCEIRAGRAAFQ
jgi:hypothetical protein